MRLTEKGWFKNLCLWMACIFGCQIVQPMALGSSPSITMPNSSKNQVTSATLFKSHLQSRASNALEKVKSRLQELEVLPSIEALTKRQITDEVSCAAPKVNPLAASTVALQKFNRHPNLLPTKGKEQLKITANEKIKEAVRTTWFDWFSSLFVGEAHAQTSDPNLASTPDANTTDQFIIDKAQELGNDAIAIFTFVRDEISYESYRGSLRGSRGALWSNAGNSLDQASLLIALLRTSGVPARYVEGTLPDPFSQELILSMFPNLTRVVGCPPANVERADPANDPQLLAETREHYWVQADLGSGFVNLDPTFSSAQIDQAFTTAGSPFSEVEDRLRHKVSVRMNVEFNNSFTGGLQDPRSVLNESFNTVELVGHPQRV